MERNEVSAAFAMVLEEIEAVIASVRSEGASALQKGEYDKARSFADVAARLNEFRGKVRNLQQEWESIFSARVPKKSEARKRRARRGPLPAGPRTSGHAFRRPILEALVELGGSATATRVFERIEERMRPMFTEYDLQPLPSSPNTVRWRNNVQWCRLLLVREGLLKAGSPRGVWEISPAGREALERGQV